MSDDPNPELLESRARLATEIAGRTEAEAARMRLLHRLVMAQEDERRRIARDLHDDLGQRLTSLRLLLARMAGNRRGDAEITQALDILASIDERVDFIAWELRPAALDTLGLVKVLETYVTEWARHSGVRGTFHATARTPERFAAEIEATLYRIAQEALNNVAKHARAEAVNVLIEQREGILVLAVEDDGIGFHPSARAETMIGLAGMRERAAAVGGSLEIEPTPGGGTTVLARIPLSMRAGDTFLATVPDDTPGNTESWPTGVSGLASDPKAAALVSIRARVLELQQAVAARDDLIATVAHELRNPIAPLTFQVRLALEKAEQIAAEGRSVPVDWVQGQLRRVEQRLHRLLETLDRLLDVSRLSTGRIDLQPEPMDLAEAVRDVIATFDAELAVARCEVTFVQRGDATGSWDRVRVEQICRNLLSNAIRFGAGRPIEVVVDGDADFARLEVCDHGIGIAPDQQARIFERFERGGNQRSGGFGIGLWLVRNICAAMGGRISVSSEPGDGACFIVMLPRRHGRRP